MGDLSKDYSLVLSPPSRAKMAAQRKLISLATGSKLSKKQNGSYTVSVSTFEKWQCEFDHKHQSVLRLRCEKDVMNHLLVATVCCGVCRRFKNRVRGVCDISQAWLTGTTSYHTCNVLDHAKSEQHITSRRRRC